MWAATTRVKLDIPLGTQVIGVDRSWDNKTLREFIKTHSTGCAAFEQALAWLGDRTCQQALRECNQPAWIEWLERRLPPIVEMMIVPAGNVVTVTSGRNEKYALWHGGIWDLPAEYIDETSINVFCTK